MGHHVVQLPGDAQPLGVDPALGVALPVAVGLQRRRGRLELLGAATGHDLAGVERGDDGDGERDEQR